MGKENETIDKSKIIEQYNRDQDIIDEYTDKFKKKSVRANIFFFLITLIAVTLIIVYDVTTGIPTGVIGVYLPYALGLVVVLVLLNVVIVNSMENKTCKRLRDILETTYEFKRLVEIKNTREYGDLLVSNSWKLKCVGNPNSYYDIESKTWHGAQKVMQVNVDAYDGKKPVELIIPVPVDASFDLFKDDSNLVLFNKGSVEAVKDKNDK